MTGWAPAADSMEAKRACKPGSVGDGHLSWRTRCRAALRTPPGCGAGRTIAPLFALAPDGVYQAAASPRRWWSLTPPFQLFPLRFGAEAPPRRWESSFLRHFPSGRPAWPLASILPCGAPDFPHAGWETPPARDRPARFAGGIVARAAHRAMQKGGPPQRTAPRCA